MHFLKKAPKNFNKLRAMILQDFIALFVVCLVFVKYILEIAVKICYNEYATQLNIFVGVYVGKNVGFACHISDDVNCVATEAKLRFSVRGFGCAPF